MNLESDARRDFQYAVMYKLKPSQNCVRTMSTCNDVMPDEVCDKMEVPKGSTFAEGLRQTKFEF